MAQADLKSIEDKVAEIFEKEHAIFTKSGTVAIWLALGALGIKGKKIIVPANVCFVVVAAIILSGNEPYFVDIDESFTLGAETVKGIDEKNIAAIIFPYMYGNTGDIVKVMDVAAKKGWIVIEDVAQALGARIGDKYAGSFCDISITSFGTGKIIDIDMGGILLTNSKQLHEKAKELYHELPLSDEECQTKSKRYGELYWQLIGRMEKGADIEGAGIKLVGDFRAAMLSRLVPDEMAVLKLEKALCFLNDETELRRRNAGYFQEVLSGSPVTALKHNDGATYWRQNILVKKNRDDLLEYLKNKGVKASKYFPSIDRLVFKRDDNKYERSDIMGSMIINLWTGKETKEKDVIMIGNLINEFCNKSNY